MYSNAHRSATHPLKYKENIYIFPAWSLRAPCLQCTSTERAYVEYDKHNFICPFPLLLLRGPPGPPSVTVSCETIRVGRGHLTHCQSTISSHRSPPPPPPVVNLIRRGLSLPVLSLASIAPDQYCKSLLPSETHLRQIQFTSALIRLAWKR